jgi:hypothetical protein
MVTVDEAAWAARVSELTICRRAEAGSFHFIGDAAGRGSCVRFRRVSQSLESAPRFLMIVPSAGVILRSIDSAVFSQNLICNTAAGPAVRFAASNPNLEVARWPIFTNGNSNVLLQSNEFLGYDPDHCGLTLGTGIAAEGFCFDNSPFPGWISDGGGFNVQKKTRHGGRQEHTS